MKKALVLTGGSIRGAFQAGAVAHVLKSGFQPDIIRGISAGALNSTYITSAFGNLKTVEPYTTTGAIWNFVGSELYALWKNNIHSYKDIIKKQYIKGAFSALTGNFSGLTSNSPLKKLVKANMSVEDLRASGLDYAVGSVNMKSGQIEYHNADKDNILDYVVSSTAIPFVMPVSKIDGKFYHDGGIRDSAPLRSAIKAGAEEIVIVSCSPVDMPYKDVNMGNIIEVADRVLSIAMNEIVRNDIRRLLDINEMVRQDHLGTIVPDKKEIKFKLIQPEGPIPISLTKFNNKDIIDMLMEGAEAANQHTWQV